MSRRLSVYRTIWPLKAPFRITGNTFVDIDAVVVEIEEDGRVGRGEGVGVYYLGETADGIVKQIETARDIVEGGASRIDLLKVMPAGGARNALDCALWDLEARLLNTSVAALAGAPLKSVVTMWTVGIAEPEVMAAQAAKARGYPVIKVKLDSHAPVERLKAIRAVRPDAKIVVDANQAFTFSQLKEVLPDFTILNVSMIEQPLPRGGDEELASFSSPIPICADESCLHREELAGVLKLYDMINIKLDKTGGLTEALALAAAAREAGKGVMVGNMMGTSLSITPSLVLAQFCDAADLDGPLLLKNDYLGGVQYHGAVVSAPVAGFWGEAPSKGAS